MKIGETFNARLFDLVEPLIGRIVVVTIRDEDGPVTARIVHANEYGATLKVVPKDTKE